MRARRTCLLAGAVAAGLLLTGCTSDDDPTPDPTTTTTAGPTDPPEEETWTPESLAEAILEDTEPETAEPIASGGGTVSTVGGEWDVVVDVLSVVAHAGGTDLVYVVRSPDGERAEADRFAWGDGRKIWNDTRSVSVFDAEADVRLLPYTGYASRVGNSADMFCVCSRMPLTVGDGDVLGALLPALTPGTTTVTIEFPGLEPITDVPVEWR